MNKTSIQNIMPSLRGLNLWTLKEKIKDHTLQRQSTIQLFQQLDIYEVNQRDSQWQQMLERFKPCLNENIRFQPSSLMLVNFLRRFGTLKKTTGAMKSHSFVVQFMQHAEVMMCHNKGDMVAAYPYAKETGGSSQAIWGGSNGSINAFLSCLAPSGTSTWGIAVGTGTTAPAVNDYKMETQIAHGVASGMLYYGSSGASGTIIVGSSCQITFLRTFGNTSGGTITLKEIGLQCSTAVGGSQAYYQYLLAHDAVNQDVTNGQTAIVTYTMQTTV
jgi:hypothetical protein